MRWELTMINGLRWSLSVLVVLVLAVGSVQAKAPPAKPTVAVMYFDYEGSDPQLAQLRKGLAQMLISDLAGEQQFQIVERSRMEALLAELKLSGSRTIDKRSALKMGRMLAARFMVFGSVMDLQGSLVLQARVVEVETTKTIKGIRQTGKSDTFFTTYEAFESDLQGILQQQLPPASRGSRVKIRKRKRPKKLTARTIAKFGVALDAGDRGDNKTAVSTLQGIVATNPDFLLAKSELKKMIQ